MPFKRVGPCTKYSDGNRTNYHHIIAYFPPCKHFPSEATHRICVSSSNFSSGIVCFSIPSARISTGPLLTSMNEGMWTVVVPEVLADRAWSLAAAARINMPGVAGAGITFTRKRVDDVGSDGAKSWVN